MSRKCFVQTAYRSYLASTCEGFVCHRKINWQTSPIFVWLLPLKYLTTKGNHYVTVTMVCVFFQCLFNKNKKIHFSVDNYNVWLFKNNSKVHSNCLNTKRLMKTNMSSAYYNFVSNLKVSSQFCSNKIHKCL